MALAKRRISRDSNEAVYEGRLTLEEARELGRDGSPYGPAPRTLSKDDRMRTCMCGWSRSTGGMSAARTFPVMFAGLEALGPFIVRTAVIIGDPVRRREPRRPS